jgi:CubicO group peptidase (beta-lactamase class C family)
MGALRSNAEDMLRFLEANVSEPVTRLERVMRMAQQVRSSADGNTDLGFVGKTKRVGARRIIGHGGRTAGYSAVLAFDPDRRVGFVQLTNVAPFGDGIGLDFLRHGPPLPLPEAAVSQEMMNACAGVYEWAPGRSVVVRHEGDGTLTLQVPGRVRFRLHATSDSTFFAKRAPWRFTFVRDDAGRVTTLIADLEGRERRMARVGGEGPPPG